MNSYGDYFRYNGSELRCEGVALKHAAVEFGTPLYVYTERGFRDRYLELDRALSGLDRLICYSVKSNSNMHILRLMASLGSGMDVVSGGEIYRALKAGVSPSKIVYAGVGKSAEEIEYALDSRILMFNCESFQEIGQISRIALEKNTVADIAVRVNPDVVANTHHYITTGKKENKFGISAGYLMERLGDLAALKGVRLRGLHSHIGSQITETGPFIAAVEILAGLTEKLRRAGFDGMEYVNLGGGFGIRYKDEESFPVDVWAAEIAKMVAPLKARLIIEPGRYLSGNNGVLLATVLYKKQSGGKTFLVTDAAMNDLIRPSLYGAYQEILNCERREGTETVDVVGPICESGDFFAKDRDLPASEQGDVLSVMSAGAYGMSMASRYNSRRLPAEVLITADGGCRLIRARDTFDDLIRNELV
jgi:diaminopimelate decarboxylase